ncbi:MAG: glycerol-3-phosphate acyltransferase, partial [Gottschalkiaceae bacterium]
MINTIIIAIISYLLGNFATSYILGKIFKKTDIRMHGSGNAGATNALRVFGIKLAAATFLFDALKGVLAVIIGRMILGDIGGYIGGVFVVVGHNWPIVLRFKGGKGVASTIGVALTINYKIALICIVIG